MVRNGGWVSQKLYRHKWESDKDVWVEDEEVVSKFRRNSWDKYRSWFDILTADREHGDGKNIQRCLERFDLSITQQGIKRDGEVYVTCASLYTLEYSKVLVNITEHTIVYNVGTFDLPEKRNCAYRLRQTIFNHHRDYGPPASEHYNSFAVCDSCRQYLFQIFFGFNDPLTKRYFESESMAKIKTWLTRLQKYRERFPNMEFIYVLNDDDDDVKKLSNK